MMGIRKACRTCWNSSFKGYTCKLFMYASHSGMSSLHALGSILGSFRGINKHTSQECNVTRLHVFVTHLSC